MTRPALATSTLRASGTSRACAPRRASALLVIAGLLAVALLTLAMKATSASASTPAPGQADQVAPAAQVVPAALPAASDEAGTALPAVDEALGSTDLVITSRMMLLSLLALGSCTALVALAAYRAEDR